MGPQKRAPKHWKKSLERCFSRCGTKLGGKTVWWRVGEKLEYKYWRTDEEDFLQVC